MKRLLITGGGGFIGAHAVPALLAGGYEVCAVGRRRLQEPTVRFIEADLLDPTQRRRAVEEAQASHLLHLAWETEPGVYWRSPRNLDWMIASLDLLRLFREAGGGRAVLAGSCAEYEWGATRFSEEETPCRPETLYGVAKDATRRMALAYARQTALSVAWARLFFIYGPGEKSGRLATDAIAALRTGIELPVTLGLHKRDFMHVADVAAALTALLDSPVDGPVNIGSGSAVPVRELLEELANQLGNRQCLAFGARPLGPGEPEVIEADIARLTGAVGFEPRFDLRSGLADTIRWTRDPTGGPRAD